MKFNDYIVYVDESGDHTVNKIDPNFPVFVLAFCIFKKDQYTSEIAPAVQSFKFKYFGHDMVILHEREIRKSEDEFSILFDQVIRKDFYSDMNDLIKNANFKVIASVVRKDQLKGENIENPYHTSLKFCLETLSDFIPENSKLHVVFEKRGKKEDNELELEFRRICDGDNRHNKPYSFLPVFAAKVTNSTGLQVADMVARPIGVNVLKPAQDNRAFSIIESKFHSLDDNYNGVGLHISP